MENHPVSATYPNHRPSYEDSSHGSSDYGDVSTFVNNPSRAGGYGETNGNAVDIEEALEEYRSVQRELSRQSRSKSATNKPTESDIEKGNSEFDLTDYLANQHEQLNAAGLKPKNMGVVWRNLKVEGVSPESRTITTNLSAFTQVFSFLKKKSSDFTILHDNNGFCKAGEMLLVLGRPGSGCSTLLRVLANMRSSYTNVEGDVSYGGIDAKEFSKYFKGEVCYNEEEDLHYPTLTTKQTLRFALKNKTPDTRIPGESKQDFINSVLYLLGNMLGLTKQMNTLVGNAFVRGLSGGERKRLSIAEQMTTSSSINCWDCSTRGLDASSALDYVRSLRIMTDIMQKTTVSTLYQASDSIFELFDKVMVLDEGRCIYFGPTSEAKSYFIDMGFYCPSRKSAPDFLTGLCNPIERQVQQDFSGEVPSNALEFEAVYKESSMYKRMMAERDAYNESICKDKPYETFREAFEQANNSPAVVSYYEQIESLTIRQVQLIWGDKYSLLVRYVDVIVKGLITASVFYKMPLDGTGAFSRGGSFLFALIFNAFVAQSELPAFMEGRRVLEKHKHFALYRPSAFYIAQVVVDIPLAIIQAILFELCVYFLMGYSLDAGKFFTFFLNLVFITLCMNSFFRFIGAVSPNFFVASQISSTFFIAYLVYSGYQITYTQMHPWLFWIYWINPIAYSFKAMVSNELKGAHFSCSGSNGVPYGPSYTDPAYRSCILPGAAPGADFVLGDDYLRLQYDYHTSQLWINIVAVILFFLLFATLAALSMEYVDLKQGSTITKVFKKGAFKRLASSKEKKTKDAKQQQEEEHSLEAVTEGTTFSWHHVNYTVPVKDGTRQLLNDVAGIVKPGHLTALMGSSGAGKTTLLDVLARRKTIGTVEGHIYLNGESLANDFERLTGYCEQMDVHNTKATVREALQFSAYLRQSDDVSKEDKDTYVEQILDLLEMQEIGDALVGDLEAGEGISVEERKRLTIAVELVGKPKLLFLDEPTSGLDAQSSFNIIRFIRKLANAGWPVLCTIHQPSATLFEHFDHLLLLMRGGRTAYYGEIGKDSRTMIDYFERNGGPTCAAEANPAEYILECVGAGTASKVTEDWADIWLKSPEAEALEQELETIHTSIDHTVKRQVKTYARPFLPQLSLVCQRMALSWHRNPSYNIGRFLNVTFIGLITGFTFWKVGNTPDDLQNRMMGILTAMFVGHTLILLVQPQFMQERLWFRREYASKYYSWFPFALSCLIVEIPYLILYSVFFLCCYYWTVGMPNESERVGFFLCQFIVYLFHSVSFGYVVSAMCESLTMAAILNPFFTTFLYLFSGLFQSPKAMPRFWSAWMYWLNPYHYFIEGLVTNGLNDIQVHCKEDDFITIKAPPGQTCGNYMADFFAEGGLGYIGNPESTDSCNYCQYSRGNDYYETNIGWSAANRWRNFGILWIYTLFNVALFVFFVYLFRKQRR